MALARAAAGGPVQAGAAAAAIVAEFAFSKGDFEFLAGLAYKHAGISLSDSKRNLVYSRLSRRLRALSLGSFAEYRQYIEGSSDEIERFINSISTNHTKFFRERASLHPFPRHRARDLRRAGAQASCRADCASGPPAARPVRSRIRSPWCCAASCPRWRAPM